MASAYQESLKLAHARGIRSVAFPSLSTGAYGYPLEEAAPIAVKAVADYIQKVRSSTGSALSSLEHSFFQLIIKRPKKK